MEIEEMLERREKELEKCEEELSKEMDTGELIYESLCHTCQRMAETIIEEDGVVNCWDDMIKKQHQDKQSEVQE